MGNLNNGKPPSFILDRSIRFINCSPVYRFNDIGSVTKFLDPEF